MNRMLIYVILFFGIAVFLQDQMIFTVSPDTVSTPDPGSEAYPVPDTGVATLPSIVLVQALDLAGEGTVTATLAVTPLPPQTPVPEPSATATPVPTPMVDSVQPQIVFCQGSDYIAWMRLIRVPKTMTRFEVWQAYVGHSVMQKDQFIEQVLIVNPILEQEGRMFKPGRSYLVPICPEGVTE